MQRVIPSSWTRHFLNGSDHNQFMQDKALSYSAKLTIAHLAKKDSFKDIRGTEHYPAYAGFNPMENMWALLEKSLWENKIQAKKISGK